MALTKEQKDAVGKAEARYARLNTDLDDLQEKTKDTLPEDLMSEADKRQRRAFLETLYREHGEAEKAFERIIQGNELQDASFLGRGALVARTVMRIVLKTPGGNVRGYGTGFLVGDGVLITNNHVLASSDAAILAEAEAYFERDIYGRDRQPWRFQLDPKLFFTSVDLDFTIVGVAPRDIEGEHQLADLGWLPLIGGLGKVADGEWLTIIQHPAGERKQICVRENRLLKRDADVLWYSTDTLGGSSGSPVFNNDWLLVALHHSGIPEKNAKGQWLTIDGNVLDSGRHSDKDIKWIANEGIRVSRIVETLRTTPTIMDNPRAQAIVTASAVGLQSRLPVYYRDGFGPNLTSNAAPPSNPGPASGPVEIKSRQGNIAMSERIISLQLAVDDSGNVRIVDQSAQSESLAMAGPLEYKKKQLEYSAPARPREDWIKGFDEEFLGTGQLRVNLPVVKKGNVAPLIDRDGVRCDKELADFKAGKSYTKRTDAYGHAMNPAEAEAGILRYNNFSAIMNPDRRLAYFVAANVDGSFAVDLGRPDVPWLEDERILPEHQLNDSFYRGSLFDRGHLARREELEWGSDPIDATRRANGTFVHTNCAPQFWKFNREKGAMSKGVLLWQGIETFVLEKVARIGKFRIQVISGPIFGEFDREFRGERIPFDYWKIVAAEKDDGTLFATAFVLSQQTFVEVGDLVRPKEAAIEEMFAQFETYQRPIEEIEKLTGLGFTFGSGKSPKALATVDPFSPHPDKPLWDRRRRRGSGPGLHESWGDGEARSPGGPLASMDDIVFD